jgi:aspartyl protease/PDZ domain-containing protein
MTQTRTPRFRLALLAAALLAGAPAAWAQAMTPSALLAANQAASGKAGAGEMDLTYAYAGQGMTGVARSVYDTASGAFVDRADIGPTSEASGFDGQTAWMRDQSAAITPEGGGDKRQLAVNEAYRNANLWWRADRGGARVESLGAKSAGGIAYDVLAVTPRGGKTFEAWFDPKTHLLARIVEPQAFITITSMLSDYRPVAGLQVPGKVVVDDGQGPNSLQTMTLDKAVLTAPRAAATYAAPKFVVADAVIQNTAGRTTVPFRLLNNHIYAEVKVNGKGPFLMIFDTGGHDILTPGTAKALGVNSEGQAVGTGAGEGTVDVGFARHVTFQVGDLVLKDQTISVLPITTVAAEGFEEQGMMGFELFRRFVTVIDYGAHTLTFIDPTKFHPADAGVAVPFVFYDHLPQVKGTFEGAPGIFDIDTGSRAEITITKPFADANHLRETHPKGVVAVDGWGVGGRSISYVTKAKSLTLGSVKVDDFIAGLATQSKGSFSDPNYQGNVGTRLLKRFVVTFDYGHQVMYLKALPAPVADIGTFDRSGVWINASPKGFKIVDVTAGSAAAEAGLKAGDEITAVDGAPASGLVLSDLRAKLRNPKVAKVALTVESGGQTRSLDLTLRDQV